MEGEGGGGNHPGDKDSPEEKLQRMSISPDREVFQEPEGGGPSSLNPARDVPPALKPASKDYFYGKIRVSTMRWDGPIFAPELYLARGIAAGSSWPEFGPPYHNPIERIVINPHIATGAIHTEHRYLEHRDYNEQKPKRNDSDSSPEGISRKDAQEMADRALAEAIARQDAQEFAEYEFSDVNLRKHVKKFPGQELDNRSQKNLQELIDCEVLGYDESDDETTGTENSDFDSGSDVDEDDSSTSPSKKPRIESPRLKLLLTGVKQIQPPAPKPRDTDENEPGASPAKKPKFDGSHPKPKDTDEDESGASQAKKPKLDGSYLKLILAGIKPIQSPALKPSAPMPPARKRPAPMPKDTFLGSLLADAQTKQDFPDFMGVYIPEPKTKRSDPQFEFPHFTGVLQDTPKTEETNPIYVSDFMRAFKDGSKNEPNPQSMFPPTRAKERLDRIRKKNQKKCPKKRSSKSGTLGIRQDWFIEDETLKDIVASLVGRLRGNDDLQLHQIQDPLLMDNQQPVQQGQDSRLQQGQDSRLQQGQDSRLQQGQDSRLQQGQDSRLQQGQDSRLQQGQDSRLQQGQDSRLQQGQDSRLQQGQDSRLQQGQDSRLQQVHDPRLQQHSVQPSGHDSRLRPPLEQDPQLLQAPDPGRQPPESPHGRDSRLQQ